MINFYVVEGLRDKRQFGWVVLSQSVCLSVVQ